MHEFRFLKEHLFRLGITTVPSPFRGSLPAVGESSILSAGGGRERGYSLAYLIRVDTVYCFRVRVKRGRP